MTSLKRAFALIAAVVAAAALLACGTTAAPAPASLAQPPPAATVAEPTATAAAPPAVEPTAAATAPAAPMIRTTEAPEPASPTESPAPASPTDVPPTPVINPTAAPVPTATPSPLPTDTPTIAPTATDAPPTAPAGTDVGEAPPSFTIERADGARIGSADLAAAGRPVFMHYFATWWPACRAELRTLNPIVAEYAGQVDFYLVAFNESAATLENYIQENGFSNMTAAQPVGSMLRDLKIVSQSSMIALDANGVITFRKGYGGRGADFAGEFSRLAQ